MKQQEMSSGIVCIFLSRSTHFRMLYFVEINRTQVPGTKFIVRMRIPNTVIQRATKSNNKIKLEKKK